MVSSLFTAVAVPPEERFEAVERAPPLAAAPEREEDDLLAADLLAADLVPADYVLAVFVFLAINKLF
jgi:hypothetical protein